MPPTLSAGGKAVGMRVWLKSVEHTAEKHYDSGSSASSAARSRAAAKSVVDAHATLALLKKPRTRKPATRRGRAGK